VAVPARWLGESLVSQKTPPGGPFRQAKNGPSPMRSPGCTMWNSSVEVATTANCFQWGVH